MEVCEAGTWFTEESNDWCSEIYLEGGRERLIWRLEIPTLMSDVFTESMLEALLRLRLENQIQILGKTKYFAGRLEWAFDASESIDLSPALRRSLSIQRGILDRWNDGVIDEDQMRAEFLSEEAIQARADVYLKADPPATIYISDVDLAFLNAAPK